MDSLFFMYLFIKNSIILKVVVAVMTSVGHAIGIKPVEALLKTSNKTIIKIIGVIFTLGIIGINLFMIVTNAAID